QRPAPNAMHKIIASLTAAALLAPAAFAQQQPQANAQRLVDHIVANSKAYETLSYLTDNIGPRLSGSKGAELAVQWTVQRFREWGIDVRTEPVTVPHWVRGEERGRLVSHNDQRIVLTALGGSVATPAKGITAEVIEVRSYDELDKLGRKNIEGKIVFYSTAMDMSLVESGRAFDAYSKAVIFRGIGASRAAAYGAVASIVRSVASASLRTPHTGSLRYDEKQPKIPAAAVTTEDAELIQRLLAKGERVRMHMLLTPKTLPDVQSSNVIAEIRGSERPEEIVLIGGHLDSWDLGTGAIDDGSGVAMVMETLRAMKQLGIVPKRTIRGVLFMNEENGLRGGRAYFAAAAKREEVQHHIAAIETDAGAAPPVGFTSTLEGQALDRVKARANVLSRIAPIYFESSKHTGADTTPLTDAGVAGFGLVPDPRHYFDFHHTPADTLDKVDPKALAQNSAAIAGLAYAIAEGGL
ncbi:MAG: M20/M25/M40 family metallo-hydrolase, partial [Acidobacteriota bacterium]|nr:M20/M25/M40 family metallo-hydrolase [Acidobacteriota bacterium]